MTKTVLAIATALSCLAATASARTTPLSVRDSFRIGSSGTIFCSAQSTSTDKALKDMFDVGYSVTCRDAALPVGKLFKLRDPAGAAGRIAASRHRAAAALLAANRSHAHRTRGRSLLQPRLAPR